MKNKTLKKKSMSKNRTYKKKNIISVFECESIQWFIDVLGIDEVLKTIILELDETIEEKDINIITNLRDYLKRRAGRNAIKTDIYDKGIRGLVYSGAHWYALRDEAEGPLDSYTLDYQKNGSAHFCQTFACFIFANVDSEYLEEKKYTQNIVSVLRFLRDRIFMNPLYSDFNKYFLNEIKKIERENADNEKYKYISGLYYKNGRRVPLKYITIDKLINFIDQAIKNARKLINCN